MKKDIYYFCRYFTRNHSPSDSPELLWNCIKKNLSNILNEHVPTKLTSTKISQPWFNTKCKKLSRRKEKLYHKKHLSSKLQKEYDDLKRETQKQCRIANNDYLLDLIKDDDNINKKKIYSYIKSKAKGHTNNINELKDHLGRLKQDATSKANILNDQFCSVFSNPSGVFTGILDPTTKNTYHVPYSSQY